MDIGIICGIIYITIGVILALYWFHKKYKEDYNIVGNDAISSIACLYMLAMCAFWPIVFVMKFIRRN